MLGCWYTDGSKFFCIVNVYVHLFLKGISEDKQAQYREKVRLRVQKYRAKKRAEGKLPAPSTSKTRAETDKRRQ